LDSPARIARSHSARLPFGTCDAFIARQLRRKRDDQDRLLASIPAVDDLQAAWLLLRFCAAPRANYLFANPSPSQLTSQRCLATLLEQGDTPLPPTNLNTAQLAQRFGGLGLRSASQDRFAAHWGLVRQGPGGGRASPRVSAPPCKVT